MEKARVSKLRPVSWRISVQGAEATSYVRRLLDQVNIKTSEPSPDPGLTEPPVFSFVATSSGGEALTTEELEAILEHDANVELEFERR